MAELAFSWKTAILLIGCAALANLDFVLAAKECGVRTNRASTKIFYGEMARLNELPWQISMQYHGRHRCGGSIIADNWIITAAHCVHSKKEELELIPAESVSILIGSLNNETPDQESMLIRAKRIVSHPKFGRFPANDIALIELMEPIGLDRAGNNINAICLGRPEDVTTHRKVVVSGWGRTENLRFPDMLRRATVQVESQEHCKKVYEPEKIFIMDGNVCATNKPGACHGDSGGPLQYEGKDGRWYLMGLVTGGLECGSSEIPAIYARVPYYLDFIREVTKIRDL